MSRPSKSTPQRRQAIVDALRKGNGYEQAARTQGLTGETIRQWRKADPQFAADCAAAEDWCADVAENVLYARGVKGETLALLAWLRAHRPNLYHRKLVVTGDSEGGPIMVDHEVNVTERVPRVLILPDNSRLALTQEEITAERLAIAVETRQDEDEVIEGEAE